MNNNAYSHRINIELVKLLYSQLKIALWAEGFVAIGVTMVLWPATNHELLSLWLAFRLIICGLGRQTLIFSYHIACQRSPKMAENTTLWLALFTVGAFLSGINWGMVGSLLMVPHDIIRQTFAIFLLIGVASAANSINSPNPKIYATLLIPAFLPFAIWLMLQGGAFIILGILACIYIVVMLGTSYYAYQLLYKSLFFQFKNADLATNLSAASATLEKRSLELEKSLSLLDATLESTTDGILVVDQHNHIEYYNSKFLKMWNLEDKNLHNQDVFEVFIAQRQFLLEPDQVIAKFNELSANPVVESIDEIKLLNGSVFERFSQPQLVGSKCLGRVWSFRNITESKSLQQKLLHQANYDLLTGLMHRSLMIEHIGHAMENAKQHAGQLAIMFLDLDQFKLINDTLGHSLGDMLLKMVAERVNKIVRVTDAVSREGGDEFLILLTDIKSVQEAASLAQRCCEALSEGFRLDSNKVNITVSIGISVYPKDGNDAETLIRNADIAMYRAKELGRNNYKFFTDEMNKRIQQRSNLEIQMREAIIQKQFFLVYQPIISLQSGFIIGVEAMLRWQHPTLGVLAPDDFMSVAEETGLILKINDWAFKTACAQIKFWQTHGCFGLQFSINMYARQFKQENILEQLVTVIRHAGIDPCSVILEASESCIMRDLDRSLLNLTRLKNAGINIAIDDFALGHSNLRYLKRLPIDKIKIGLSSLTDISQSKDEADVTAAIIAMASKLNLKVTAEGVQNEEEINFLLKCFCDEAQGSYFSEPLKADACFNLIQTRKALVSIPTNYHLTD